ncbi:hypothetical protein [Methyloversatilis thermotolerans]|uniref:hypothetical protein n=1 Tax=Methyloversatilis thermotolerans TaxID=1346290 RepID=UPI0003771DD0|nr:hypothetical protein [Methyloversatilis thermotolerans]
MNVAIKASLISLCAVLAAACDRLPIPDPNKQAMQKEQDAKAIGGACRHAGRALEDCYNLNPKASKAAIFAGWREMNDYMTQNKIDVVLPSIPPNAGSKKVKSHRPPEDSEQTAEPAPDQGGEPENQHGDSSHQRNPALTAG